MDVPYVDVLLDIPELDGKVLRAGTQFRVEGLSSTAPQLYIGRDLTFTGVYQDFIGTQVTLSRCLTSEAGVKVVSKTCKRLVFTRSRGSLEQVQELFKRGPPSSAPTAAAAKPPKKRARVKKEVDEDLILPRKRERRGGHRKAKAGQGEEERGEEEEEEEEEEVEEEEEEVEVYRRWRKAEGEEE